MTRATCRRGTTVVQQAVSLTQAFNRISTQLNNIRTGLDGETVSNVADINDITDQILQLNQMIVQVEVTGQAANDFRDRRDLLVDRLSQLVQTSVGENTDGSINVLIGRAGAGERRDQQDATCSPSRTPATAATWTSRYGSGGPAGDARHLRHLRRGRRPRRAASRTTWTSSTRSPRI